MSDEEHIVLSVEDPAVAALMPRYLERRAADLETLRAALKDGTFDPIALVGHRMRGSGTAYGIPQVTELGTALEKAARSEDAAAALESTDHFEAFLARVRLS